MDSNSLGMVVNRALDDSFTELDVELHYGVMGLMAHAARAQMAHAHKGRMSFECHSICHGIGLVARKLKVIDGDFLGLRKVPREDLFIDSHLHELTVCSHSWLETPDGAIIDPYPVGFLTFMPVLVASRGEYEPYGKGLYSPNPEVTRRIYTAAMHRKSKVFAGLIRRGAEMERVSKN